MDHKVNQVELTNICPSKSNCDWEFLYYSEFQNYKLPIYICQSCKLQAQFPVPKSIDDVYNENYYSGKSEYSYVDERKYEKYFSYVWDARIKNILKFKKGGSLLEIGSSFGGFLKRAKLFGFEIQGVEVSKYSSDYANSQGIPTISGDFLSAELPEKSFDVILMTEVIEHLKNPFDVFKKLHQLLKPNGLLILQTANFEGKQAMDSREQYHYYLPGHLFYYSHSNLIKILTIHGWNQFLPHFGVDFPLIAKLKKSRGWFQKFSDYSQWIRIIYYHFKSKITFRNIPLTSSYVLYAWKSSHEIQNPNPQISSLEKIQFNNH